MSYDVTVCRFDKMRKGRTIELFSQFEMSLRMFVALTKNCTLWEWHIMSIFGWVWDRDKSILASFYCVYLNFILHQNYVFYRIMNLLRSHSIRNTQTHITFTSNRTSYKLVNISISSGTTIIVNIYPPCVDRNRTLCQINEYALRWIYKSSLFRCECGTRTNTKHTLEICWNRNKLCALSYICISSVCSVNTKSMVSMLILS